MNQLIPFGPTMTSREIAELTGKRHDNVMRTCRELKALDVTPQIEECMFIHSGNSYPEFRLNKRDSLVLTARLSPEFTGVVVDRWMTLEAGPAAATFQIPTTLAGALQLAANQAKLIEEQSAALEAAQPALQMVNRYIEAKSSKCLSDVAKILQQKPQAFIKRLADDGLIFKRSGSWGPFQQHIDNGRFAVKTGESSGHAYHQTRVEPAGIEWLARRFGSAS